MIVGIIARYNENKRRYQVSSPLTDCLIQYHAFPLLIYPDTDLKAIVKLCDALIISGGDDIHPKYYDENIHESMTLEDEKIDALDFLCLEHFLKAQKPILGICRGIQVIGVYFGCKLCNISNHQNTHHELLLHPHSLFHAISAQTGSYHHQALASVPKGFLLSAKTQENHIEAIEKKDVFAVQWHPELEENDSVIPLFLQYTANKKIKQKQNGKDGGIFF